MDATNFTDFEIKTFLSKFLYLSSRGYASNLQFTSSYGNISVNMQANLGSIFPPRCEMFQQKVKPSRRRRRRRRERARNNNATNVPTEDISTNQSEADDMLDEITQYGVDSSDSNCDLIMPGSSTSSMLDEEPWPKMPESITAHIDDLSTLSIELPSSNHPTLQQHRQLEDSKSVFSLPDYSDSFDKMIDKFQSDLKSSLENSLQKNLKSTLENELARISTDRSSSPR